MVEHRSPKPEVAGSSPVIPAQFLGGIMFIYDCMKYFNDVKLEVKKVKWASKKDVVSCTIAVLLIVSFSAIFLLCFDFIFFKLMELLLGISYE